MFKSKIQKPKSKIFTKLEIEALRRLDTEEVRKQRERHVANLQTRSLFLQAQRRANYKDEYDRLSNDALNLHEVKRRHGDVVAANTAKDIHNRHNELKQMYKQAFNMKHEIQK